MGLVLIGCEESQEIAKAFRAAGHEAYSCDLQGCSGGRPDWHIKADVLTVIGSRTWDLFIGHPPCPRLCNSVWWYIMKNNLYHEVKEAADFFNALLNSGVKRIAIENPVQNKEAKKYIIRQTQSIQPYNFGDDASKHTCLWLKNLPPLVNTVYCEPRIVIDKNGKPQKRWANQTDGGWNRLGPSEKRAKERAKTYPGIAKAMAEQWGPLL